MDKQDAAIMIANLIMEEAAKDPYNKLSKRAIGDQKLTICMTINLECTTTQVTDMLAFIAFAKAMNKSNVYIAGNLMHDIQGIWRCERGFSPRTAGYTERARQYLDSRKV